MPSDVSGPPDWCDIQNWLRQGEAARILIVDDEEPIRKLLGTLLEPEGYQLDFCASGEEGLERVRRQAYDVLIVDKNLPGLSGMDLLREAQALQPRLASIVITAYSSYESVVEAMRLSACDYIEKPFESVQLVREKVAKVLARKQDERENRVLADCIRESYLAHKRERPSSSPDDAGTRHLGFEQAVAVMAEPMQQVRAALRRAESLTSKESQLLAELRGLLDNAWAILWKVLVEIEKKKG